MKRLASDVWENCDLLFLKKIVLIDEWKKNFWSNLPPSTNKSELNMIWKASIRLNQLSKISLLLFCNFETVFVPSWRIKVSSFLHSFFSTTFNLFLVVDPRWAWIAVSGGIVASLSSLPMMLQDGTKFVCSCLRGIKSKCLTFSEKTWFFRDFDSWLVAPSHSVDDCSNVLFCSCRW